MPKAGIQVMMFVATAAEWAVPHEILEENWIGVESDTGLMKLGNGVTRWINLPYMSSSQIIPGGVPYTGPTTKRPAEYKFAENLESGVNFLTLQAPATLAADGEIELPGQGDVLVGQQTPASLWNKTLVIPTIAGIDASSTGIVMTKVLRFAETEVPTPGVPWAKSVLLAPETWLHDVRIVNVGRWRGHQALMNVGDTEDADGYFTNVNLRSTDLLEGEVLALSDSTLWGGKQGVYLDVATGRRGQQFGNCGCFYKAGSSLIVSITSDGGSYEGQTYVMVSYSRNVAT